MATLQTNPRPVNLTHGLAAATNRAKAFYPQDAQKIGRGLALVLRGLVQQLDPTQPRHFVVGSATGMDVTYTVVSNGTTSCTCPDYRLHHADHERYLCKHGWAVLLVRAADRHTQPPRYRHAYHLVDGVEGYAHCLGDGRVQFHPGGRKYGFVCAKEELCIGPFVVNNGRPF